MKGIVYISGPISGNASATEDFAVAEKCLSSMGYNVCNPLSILIPPCTIGAVEKWRLYMRACIRELMNAEAIYMLNGWEDSKGAKMEHAIAVGLGMEVLYEPDNRNSQTGFVIPIKLYIKPSEIPAFINNATTLGWEIHSIDYAEGMVSIIRKNRLHG